MLDRLIAGIASLQYGLFSRQQVLDAGGDDDLIKRRLRSERWIQIHPGVYSLPGWPDSWHRRLWAMYLALGDRAVASNEAAASLRGMQPFPKFGQLEFSVPHGQHILLPATFVRQPRDLRPHHVGLVDGMRVTTVARTLCDLAGQRRRERLAQAIERADLAGNCPVEETIAMYEELRAPGKPGFRMLGQILETRAPDFAMKGSYLEKLFRRLLTKYGIRHPIWEFPLPWDPDRRADGCWLDRHALLELDSRTWHARIDQMTADRRRDREARRHGLVVHRFTYEEVKYQPESVVAEVRDILGLAA